MPTELHTPSLAWSDALALDLPLMDDTHREFVALLADAEASPDGSLAAAWQAVVDHTQDHFDREDQWMRQTRFASVNCHSSQHQAVLQVLRELARRAGLGDLAPVREVIPELAAWFSHHAQSMDAALALHLRRVGYDPATGIVAAPEALPQAEITGCGSGRCG